MSLNAPPKSRTAQSVAALLGVAGIGFALAFVAACWDLADDVRFTLALAETAGLAVVAAVCFVGAAILTALNQP